VDGRLTRNSLWEAHKVWTILPIYFIFPVN